MLMAIMVSTLSGLIFKKKNFRILAWICSKIHADHNLRVVNSRTLLRRLHMMRCAISYYLYKFKNVKNAHEEVLHLVKLQTKACNFTKFIRSNTPPWVFSRFLNCANGTKSRKASHIMQIQSIKNMKSLKACYIINFSLLNKNFWK